MLTIRDEDVSVSFLGSFSARQFDLETQKRVIKNDKTFDFHGRLQEEGKMRATRRENSVEATYRERIMKIHKNVSSFGKKGVFEEQNKNIL